MIRRLNTSAFQKKLEVLRREISEARSLGALYRAVGEGFARLFQARMVILFHEDECQAGLRPVFSWPEKPLGVWSSLRITQQDPLYQAIEQSNGPVVPYALLLRRERNGRSRAAELLARIGTWDFVIPLRQQDYLAGAVFLSGVRRAVAANSRSAVELNHLTEIVAYALMVTQTMERLQREAKEKAILLEIGKKVSSSLDIKEVLKSIVSAVREVVPCDHAAVFLLDQDKGELRHAVYEGTAKEAPRNVRLKVGQGLVGWVAITGQPVLIRDVRSDTRYVRLFPDSRAELDVPIKRGDRVFGVISLESNRKGAFNEHHLELLQAFAGQAAVAIENALLLDELVEKRRLEQELEIAREVQRALLPQSLPKIRGYRLAGITIPSGMVGGDLYDVVQFGDGSVSFAVGDVAGKGTPGAILMATLYSTYRGLLRKGLDPAKLMRSLNNLLVERLDSESFATFFLAVLRPEEHRLVYCNAGHNPPILVRSDGHVMKLTEGGPVLGFVPGLSYVNAEVKLEAGDLLVMYTDGVTEAANSREEMFGEQRLIDLLVENRHLDPRRLRDKVVHEVKTFCGSELLQDDLTLLILKVSEQAKADHGS